MPQPSLVQRPTDRPFDLKNLHFRGDEGRLIPLLQHRRGDVFHRQDGGVLAAEAGLVVARGNPKGVSQVSHLGKKGLRVVSREPGSGARRLLDRELKRAGLSVDIARDAAIQASGHLEVAHAVSIGAADVGIATRDAALVFGLTFVPIAEERYDLVVPLDELNDLVARNFVRKQK